MVSDISGQMDNCTMLWYHRSRTVMGSTPKTAPQCAQGWLEKLEMSRMQPLQEGYAGPQWVTATFVTIHNPAIYFVLLMQTNLALLLLPLDTPHTALNIYALCLPLLTSTSTHMYLLACGPPHLFEK